MASVRHTDPVPPAAPRLQAPWIRPALFGLFILGLVATAWVHDDAYISFRTVENVVEGRGLTWNAGQRVQAFTHPLWFFVHVVLFAATREIYFTTLAVCFLCSLLTVYLLAFRLAPTVRLGAAVLAALLLSQGFVDYSTSGLENPLTHLLIVLLVWKGWRRDGEDGSLFVLAALTSLAALNRLDSLALLLPGVLPLGARQGKKRLAQAVLVVVLPLLAWQAFSLIYFGFPFPNTAQAKLGTGVSIAGRMLQGGYYFASSLVHDGFTVLFGAFLLWAALRRATLLARAAAFGVGLHLAYLLWIGGDYMSGRLLTAPYLLLLATWLTNASPSKEAGGSSVNPRFATWLAVAVVALAVRTGASLAGPTVDSVGIGDERRFWHPHTGLVYHLIRHPWAEQTWRLEPGVDCDPAACIVIKDQVGLYGFRSGPEVYLVDRMALTDPFLARLPGQLEGDFSRPGAPAWRPGHVRRPLPAGFLDSIATRSNRIQDPAIAELYDAVTLASRGPLWTRSRWRAIWQLNTKGYPVPARFAEDPEPAGMAQW